MCVLAKEIGELINFSIIGSPLSNSAGLVKLVQVNSCREVVLVVLAVEQGGGLLDAFMLGQVLQLVLVGGHVVGSRVRSVPMCGSVSTLS